MQQDNILSFVCNSVLVAFIPNICKWMTAIPQPVYYYMAGFCLLFAIIAMFVSLNQPSEKVENSIQRFKWSLYSLILSIAFISCTFIYPSISVPDSEQTNEFISKFKEIDSLKVLADNGNVNAMIDLGIAYSGYYESEMAFVNYPEAEKYFEMAAVEAHSAKAYALLAQLKYRGYGRKKSRQRALEDLAHGYQIDSCNFDIFKLLAEMKVREHELPEVVGGEERWLGNYLINRICLQQIINQFESLCNSPIVDNDQIVAFCSSKLPEIDSLARIAFNTPFTSVTLESDDFSLNDIQGTKNKVAFMCLYANEHTKSFEYVKDYLDRYDSSGDFSRSLFTEKQRYSERQERIDTVLTRTVNGMLNLMVDHYSQPLGLDPYYQQALRLEQLKRKVNGGLKDDDAFKELHNNYTDLIDSFIHTPAKVGPISPLPYLQCQIEPDRWSYNIKTSLHYP